MKVIFALLLAGIMQFNGFAQSVGIGTASPAPGAILDLHSTSQAFLLPRLTTAQRNSISNPAGGMLIYNTDSSRFQGAVTVLSNGTSYFTQEDSAVHYNPGVTYACCQNGYVQFFVTHNFTLKRIQLLLSNTTGNPEVLQIGIGDFGANPNMGMASAVIPANTSTPVPVDFTFISPIALVTSGSYKIFIEADNQNVQWQGTTGSAWTSICGTANFNIGLAYKLFSYFSNSTLKDSAVNYSGISYPCCVNGYVEFGTGSDYSLSRIQLMLRNPTAVNQTLQIALTGGAIPSPVVVSGVVPANSNTSVPVDFILPAPLALSNASLYFISVNTDNQNVFWQGTTGSVWTSVCGNSGSNIGLSYKLFTAPFPITSWVDLH